MRPAPPNVAARRTRVGACLVAFLLCLPARAADVVDVERAVLVVDGGAVSVDGGVWLSDGKALALAKERAECRERTRHLTESAGKVEASTLVGVGAVSMVVGAGLAALIFAFTR